MRTKALIYENNLSHHDIWASLDSCWLILISSLLKDGEPIIGNWEPLISQNDFWKLQEILNGRSSGYQHQKVADYKPLNRLVKCNDCGTYLVGYLVKKKNLGYYVVEEDAARAYDQAARLQWGDFAVVNFPTDDG